LIESRHIFRRRCGNLVFGLLVITANARADDSASSATETTLHEIIVSAQLIPAAELDVPASVRVLDGATLRAAGEQHFEDVLALVPNLNWAGDTSRPRYFQVRGIGELEQYQGAPNPSIGFLIDDIDFSGLGTAATLFDVDHIEVLRGPQGARYGANALGGLIYVQSAAPEQDFGGRVELSAGDYAMRSYGAVITGPVPSLDSAFRLAAQRFSSDGYYRNSYLGRSDTDRNDESTVRARWRYDPSDRLRLDLSLLNVRIANGYDAWSIFGGRTTQSDQPSVDAQNSTGISARLDYRTENAATLTLIGTYANSRIRYGFDSDFGDPVLWAPYTFQYSDLQIRDRRTKSIETRLARENDRGIGWIVGLYAFELTEAFDESSPGIYLDPFDPTQDSISSPITTSRYRSRNEAVFAQINGQFAARWQWSLGVRAERRSSTYADLTTDGSAEVSAHSFSPTDHLWGGNAALDYHWTDAQRFYLQVARGYKAGGFNLGPGLPANQLLFAPESDLGFEIGYKADLDEHRLRIDADVFYTQRRSLQLKSSEQLEVNDPTSFVSYTSNSASGRNFGFEATAAWRAVDAVEISASAGLLDARYHGLYLNGVLSPDRALPHAPDWQGALASTWYGPAGVFVRTDVTGCGSFYYDLPAADPFKSSPYVLFNAKAGIERKHWLLSAWVRNIGGKQYGVRGFYFGDVPPDFPNLQFQQLGPPRTFGVDFNYKL
jgi:iron complex outermembrane recepter protein